MLLNGNEHAHRMFYEKYRPFLFRTIKPIAKTIEDTEEILQDVFLKIFRSLPDYQHQGLKTWMARIAVNKAIDFTRKKQRIPKEEASDKDLYIIEGTLNQPERTFLEKEKREILHRRLESVPQNYREVLSAFYLEEKSQREIAESQGVQEKTVEMKLYRARRWVKEHWKEDAK